MKKHFLLLGIILWMGGFIFFQYVKAEDTPDDFSLNLQLMNRLGGVYEVTKCGKFPTLMYVQEENYVCTDKIVPGTQDAMICDAIHAYIPLIITPCCKRVQ